MRSSRTFFRCVAWTSLACAAWCAFVVQRPQTALIQLASRQQPSRGVPPPSPLFEAAGIWRAYSGDRHRFDQRAARASAGRFEYDLVGRHRSPTEQDFRARAYQLRNPRPELRIAALQRIYDLYDQRGSQLVLESLHDDPDASVRLVAARLLSNRYAENRQVLHAALRNDPSAEVRKGVVRLIHSSREAEDRAFIFAALRNDRSADVRKEVIALIGPNYDAEVRAALRAAIADAPEVAALAFARMSVDERLRVADQAWQVAGQELSDKSRFILVDELIRVHRKSTVEHAINLLEQLDRGEAHYAEQIYAVIVQELEKHFRRVYYWPARPLPQTTAQWRAWWTDVSDNVDEGLQWRDRGEADFPTLETDPNQLAFAAKLDGDTFRPQDPIRLELSLTNHSQLPCWAVAPRFDHVWQPVMFGVHLERIGDRVEVLHHADAGALDFFGFGGPMYHGHFQLVTAGRTLTDVSNLRSWLSWQTTPQLWPLAEGVYELTITFDGPRMPQYDSRRDAPRKPRALVRRWTAETVRFEIRGAAIDDPEEVVRAVTSQCGRPALLDELQSKDQFERDWAEQLLMQWGDQRLLPLLKGKPAQTERFGSQWTQDWRSQIVFHHGWDSPWRAAR